MPERIALGRMATRTAADYGQQCKRVILPALGRVRVADVQRTDVERMVATLAPVARNRVLALTSRLFRLFETWEWTPQQSNPVRGVEHSREEPRDRVLAPSELGALAGALRSLASRYPVPVSAIYFAAVTGLRIGEVLAIRWEHVAVETGRLTMPSTKTGRRVHDLPTAALEVLDELPRINANPFTFTTGRNAPMTYRHARDVFAQAVKMAGLGDVRLHDLRRTVMTSAAAAGVGTHVLRDLLGHKTTAMADRYVRAVGNPVRDAREQVGAAMAAMMAGKTGEVVPMGGDRG